jgi:UDP-N-acetylmuramyl pentapeptide phosphotransferase/UDP-N-acetylglucosamine-1-phosphate transferase
MVVRHAPELESLGNALQMAIGTILPFVIIVFCNIWIIIVLRNASKKTGKMGVSEEGQKTREKETAHLTRMLILVSIAYVTTSVPLRMYEIIFALPEVKGHYRMKEEYWQLRFYCLHLIISEFWDVNYGINFYLYCLGGGKKYRYDVKRRLGQLLSCGK